MNTQEILKVSKAMSLLSDYMSNDICWCELIEPPEECMRCRALDSLIEVDKLLIVKERGKA